MNHSRIFRYGKLLFRRIHEFDVHLDPETHLQSNISNPCKYYAEGEFNLNLSARKFVSFIHFNTRGVYTNFNQMKDYLNSITCRLSIFALSETCLSQEKGVDFIN